MNNAVVEIAAFGIVVVAVAAVVALFVYMVKQFLK